MQPSRIFFEQGTSTGPINVRSELVIAPRSVNNYVCSSISNDVPRDVSLINTLGQNTLKSHYFDSVLATTISNVQTLNTRPNALVMGAQNCVGTIYRNNIHSQVIATRQAAPWATLQTILSPQMKQKSYVLQNNVKNQYQVVPVTLAPMTCMFTPPWYIQLLTLSPNAVTSSSLTSLLVSQPIPFHGSTSASPIVTSILTNSMMRSKISKSRSAPNVTGQLANFIPGIKALQSIPVQTMRYSQTGTSIGNTNTKWSSKTPVCSTTVTSSECTKEKTPTATLSQPIDHKTLDDDINDTNVMCAVNLAEANHNIMGSADNIISRSGLSREEFWNTIRWLQDKANDVSTKPGLAEPHSNVASLTSRAARVCLKMINEISTLLDQNHAHSCDEPSSVEVNQDLNDQQEFLANFDLMLVKSRKTAKSEVTSAAQSCLRHEDFDFVESKAKAQKTQKAKSRKTKLYRETDDTYAQAIWSHKKRRLHLPITSQEGRSISTEEGASGMANENKSPNIPPK